MGHHAVDLDRNVVPCGQVDMGLALVAAVIAAPAVMLALNWPLGFFVVMLTAPPSVLRPNSVPCGPFSTSMFSTS
jgi:hypothetical protein